VVCHPKVLRREFSAPPAVPPNPLNGEAGQEIQHIQGEATATPEQFETAVVAAQQAFKATFGDAAFQEATTITPPPEKKKEEPK